MMHASATAQINVFCLLLRCHSLTMRPCLSQVDADLYNFRCDVSSLIMAEAGQLGLADDGVLSR